MPKRQPKKSYYIPSFRFPQMIKKFNFKKKFNGKPYDQIAHESSKRKAKAIKNASKKKGYLARLTYHPLKKDKHYDVYIRKE